MRHLPRQLPRPGATLLDVGCGNGEFLAMARAAGWQVQGVDFDPLAVAAAHKRGLDVRQGGLEQVAHHAAHYDWITCSHVIEHVHDPVQWLQDMVKLLRPGATLWLQTPNIDSVGHEQFGADWRDLDAPRHLVIFNTRTLLQLFTRLGLTPRLHRLPILPAMATHATSEALREGRRATLSLRLTELLRMRYLAPALHQAWSVQHAEFITIMATKAPFTEPVTPVK
jgi:2-polyprenyl-3-methyl-5-hydroxy-6-metoxy-1,4-benzoquinol methylase